jgi:hypothetical protein
MKPIADALLARVTGGNMPWDPNLLATVDQIGNRKREPKQTAQMLQAVNGIREALSGVTDGSQNQQQSQQLMQQMMQQMMGGRR